MTLTEFLLARIAEDEADARSVLAEYESSPPSVYEMVQVPTCEAGDPARVLAECEAKRRIVEDAQGCYRAADERGDPFEGGVAVGHTMTLRHLADVYSDHPDYRDEWRP